MIRLKQAKKIFQLAGILEIIANINHIRKFRKAFYIVEHFIRKKMSDNKHHSPKYPIQVLNK